MKIRVDDKVLVIAGKYKGKNGRVLRLSDKHNQVVVEKVNLRTRHIKKKQGQRGQKIQFEAPMNVSNVMIVCPQCSKPTRVGMAVLKTGRKQRICKKCDQSLDKTIMSKRTKKA